MATTGTDVRKVDLAIELQILSFHVRRKASAAADLDPDRISFAQVLRLIRRTATGTAAIPPCGLG